MEGVLEKCWVVGVIFAAVLLSEPCGARAQQVPGYFIFGDSLVDNGNNNQLSSLARANYLPYGIDFPRGPTGRFSNGRTTVDVIAEQLGFRNYIPPYATARGRAILGGVNYASAAAGIRDETGQQLILYNYGARKFVLIGVGQIGCSPSQLAQNSPDGRTCVQRVNSANQIFNNKLRSLVAQFNGNTPDARFIYINAYGIFQDIISRPATFGFTVTNAGCCGVGRNNGQITCLPLQNPCRNRNQYVFWDAFHPTEAANVIIGRRSYSAQSASDTYPFDIRRLAQS
ncbi:GDSL esterase/lipase [Populus alba x Populus x berolinensis]|uniref:GDSL esterase/lipase n=1 Tax=Populus alba x Populus x berolinensis TaxID=444605 RepID=A0AAD6W5K3_9ROSI|nr:GDSL esterase/lipase [Populus alba x Populus x berolinensis]